jgi:hypothetical protein
MSNERAERKRREKYLLSHGWKRHGEHYTGGPAWCHPSRIKPFGYTTDEAYEVAVPSPSNDPECNVKT